MTNTAKKLTVDATGELPAEAPLEAPSVGRDQSLVGVCVADKHPVLEGRARVRWEDAQGVARESWVPSLRGVVVREQDRVLLLFAANQAEPVVVGVLDGFRRRAEPPRDSAINLELKADEVFRVTSERGEPLVEIVQGSDGPVVKLLSNDAHIELPGKLKIRAAEIEMSAERGKVKIEASDDVEIKGEMVRLN